MQRLPTITEDIADWIAVTPALTARDRELFGHLVDGRSQRQISVAMGISINTVRGRKRRLVRKLDVAPGDDGLIAQPAVAGPG
jgi:DNA-binding CsgD family transcriptional regulator